MFCASIMILSVSTRNLQITVSHITFCSWCPRESWWADGGPEKEYAESSPLMIDSVKCLYFC